MKNTRLKFDFRFILLLSGIIALTNCNSNNNDLSLQLQSKLDSAVNAKLIPGICLSVLNESEEPIALAAGYSDVEEQGKMQPNETMFSGSIGKTYVSAVVLKLMESGILDINRKAADYMGNELWFYNLPNSQEFTVKMLLNHTAGVPEYVYFKEIWRQIQANPDKVWTAGERLEVITTLPPSNEPGKAWNYADSHYIILGAIIEKVTGKTYYEVLDSMILKPFELNQTKPAVKRYFSNLSSGYTDLSAEFFIPQKVTENHTYCFNPQFEWTGGGLVTTASDLCKWANLLYGGKVLKPETMKLLFEPAPFPTGMFEKAEYGLGCFIGKTFHKPYYGHTGFVPGYISIMQYIPDTKTAIAIQVNSDFTHQNYNLKFFFNELKEVVLEFEK